MVVKNFPPSGASKHNEAYFQEGLNFFPASGEQNKHERKTFSSAPSMKIDKISYDYRKSSRENPI